MLERVYDTLKAIIYNEMPKDINGKSIVFDRPVTGWYFGERDIKNTNLSFTFKGGQSNLKDIALGLQEITYTINIEVDAGADNIEISERLVQESVRILLAIMRKHRRIWVCELCPICEKLILSPEHYLTTHQDILNSYAEQVVLDYEALWYQTHPSTLAPATLPQSAKATESFLRMYDDVKNNVSVANLNTRSLNNIRRMQTDFVEPIRILYDVISGDNRFSDDATSRALQKGGGITITAKELLKIQTYGPDNVPTNALKFK